MNDQPDLPPLQALVRAEPVQQRSAQRVVLLLDAAAALIDENGIDGLTTSDVAARSASSVGVVYRYFPNIQSLLRALAARNLERFTERVYGTMADNSGQWVDTLDVAIDTFVEFNRSEAGFRALRFGDVIDDRFLEPEFSNNGVLARAFAGLLADKYDFETTDAFVFDLEVVVEIADGLLKRAFLLERQGDERFIQKAREIARDYLGQHPNLPTGPAGIAS